MLMNRFKPVGTDVPTKGARPLRHEAGDRVRGRCNRAGAGSRGGVALPPSAEERHTLVGPIALSTDDPR